MSIVRIRSALRVRPAAFLALLAIALPAALSAEPRGALDPSLALQDVQLARAALERLHAGYDRYADPGELAQRWARLEREARNGATFESLYLGLSGLLATLGCDHTKAEFPAPLAEQRETAPVYLPFRFHLFGDYGDWRMLVERSATADLDRGDEILEIDGDPVSRRVDAIWPLIPVDGRTEHVRALEIASSGEFLGSGFDQFDPLLNPDDEQVRLTVRDARGAEREVVAERIGFSAFRAMSEGETRWQNFSDPGAVEVTYPRNGIALLRVETFVNYRTPIDPAEVLDPVFESIRNRGVKRLVVDLRGSGGGSDDVQRALIERLISEPVQTVAETRVRSIDLSGLREHLSTWSQAAMNPDPAWFIERDDYLVLRPEIGGSAGPIRPHPLAFEGELVVLIGPANSSGATMMIGAVRQAGNAFLIGETTGGNQAGPTAGILYYLDLPNSGIRIRIPAQRSVMALDDVIDGEGYAPDLEITLDIDDWRAERDPVLQAALADPLRRSASP